MREMMSAFARTRQDLRVIHNPFTFVIASGLYRGQQQSMANNTKLLPFTLMTVLI
jgi:hypothetical protein